MLIKLIPRSIRLSIAEYLTNIDSRKSMKWSSEFNISHLSKDGKILFEDSGHNMLHDEGEQFMLSASLATNLSTFGAPPANVYMGLDNRATLAEADNLASLVSEPSTYGYARVAISTAGTGLSGQDWVLSIPATSYQLKSKTCTFIASGGSWGPVQNLFIATSVDASGKLMSSKQFTTRTPADGESITANYTIRLHE